MTASGPQLGTLASNLRVAVDRFGTLRPSHGRWTLSCVIGADDQWRDPQEEPSVRQRFVNAAPIVETAVSVPGGAVRWRVAVANGPIGLLEIQNDSPGATAIAFVLRSDWAINASNTEVSVGGDIVLKLPRPMTFGAAGHGARSALDVVMRGAAERKPSWMCIGPDAEMVVLLPLGHGASVTVEIVLDEDDPIRPSRPTVTQIAAGWEQQLARGGRVVLPDPIMNAATQVARGLTLLAGTTHVDVATMTALEDWGFDLEAGIAWQAAKFTQRRSARKREVSRSGPDSWHQLSQTWTSMQGSAFLGSHAPNAARWLNDLRSLLISEKRRGVVELLQYLPAEWAGAPLEVYDLPIRGGTVSYAIRWHGLRPALLWDVEGVSSLTIPGVDPKFQTSERRGELLLAAPVVHAGLTEMGATFS